MRVARMPPASSPIAGRRDQQRIEAEHAAGVRGQRRAVQPELPEPDHGQHDQDEVDPEPLGERPADLAREPRPDAGRVAARQRATAAVRATTQAAAASDGDDHHVVVDRRGRGDPGVRERPDRCRAAWTTPTARHGAMSAAGIASSSASPKAIAAEWTVLAPRDRSSATSTRRRSMSMPGDEHDRVAGEDRELDRQEQHAAPADERPPVDLGEDRRQLRLDAQRAARQAVVAEPVVERVRGRRAAR